MALHDHLSAIKTKSSPPPEIAAVMQRTKADLAASGLADKTPKSGDSAPEITLPNIYGDTVNSTKLLSRGPVILHFYRGGW
mgnify:CR=1 FL=1